MKRLIALLFCLALLATAARAEYPQSGKISPKVQPGEMAMRKSSPQELESKVPGLKKAVTEGVKVAQKAAPAKINGEKRLVTVRLELQRLEDNEEYMEHRYWYCPAVIFTKDGALAFDGECWKAFEEAAKLPVGPVAHFRVDLGNFGEYSTGEHAGELFYFMASYVANGPGDEYTHSVDESFARSADKTYIVYKRSLFNAPNVEQTPDNSEVKKAIANYYAQNNLKEVTAETLSKYFQQKHASTKREVTHFPY